MKIIITENKLFNSIYGYLEKTFIEEDELHWTYAEDLSDEFGNEDENLIIFYRGDWEGEDYSDIVFTYYAKDYFEDKFNLPVKSITSY